MIFIAESVLLLISVQDLAENLTAVVVFADEFRYVAGDEYYNFSVRLRDSLYRLIMYVVWGSLQLASPISNLRCMQYRSGELKEKCTLLSGHPALLAYSKVSAASVVSSL